MNGRITKLFRCFRDAVAVAMFVFACQRLLGVEFQISGELITRDPVGIQAEEFEVFVRDENWLIIVYQKSFPPIYTNVMLLDYYSFNNQDCVYTIAYAQDAKQIIDRILADPRTPADWKLHPENLPINMAWIDRAFIPHADSRFSLPFLFYAFCSSKYLDLAKTNRFEPPFPVDGRLYSYDEGVTNVTVKIERNREEPFLPEYIAFLHNDKWMIEPGRLIPVTPEWMGATNAEFKVVTFTNLGGLTLPSNPQMTVFDLDSGASGDRLIVKPQTQIRCQVKSVRLNCEKTLGELKPAVRAFATFKDKRFASGIMPLVIDYSTNAWLAKDVVVSLPEFKDAKNRQGLELHRLMQAHAKEDISVGRKTLVLMILIVASLLIFFLLWRLHVGTSNEM